MAQGSLRGLTWKYFIDQKIQEVIIGLQVIVEVFFVAYVLPLFLSSRILGGGSICYYCTTGEEYTLLWISGLLISVIFLILFAGLLVIIEIIEKWINSNWEKAKKRAKSELNKKRRKK
jgi:hypothetical protein